MFRNVDVRGFCEEVGHVCILDNLHGSLHNDSQEVKARYMIVSGVLREKGWESYIPCEGSVLLGGKLSSEKSSYNNSLRTQIT